MGLVLFELLRCSRGRRMRQNERAACRKTRSRNLHDECAVYVANDALNDHLLRKLRLLRECRVLLDQVRVGIRAHADAARVRDVGVADALLRVEEQLVSIGLSRRGGAGVACSNGRLGELAEYVGVVFRDDDLVGLSAQSLTCIHDHLGLILVALVDLKGEAAVSRHGHLLYGVGQFVRIAVAVQGISVKIVHADYGDAEDLDSLDAGELVVVIQDQRRLRRTSKSFVYLSRILAGKIDSCLCHNYIFLSVLQRKT